MEWNWLGYYKETQSTKIENFSKFKGSYHNFIYFDR